MERGTVLRSTLVEKSRGGTKNRPPVSRFVVPRDMTREAEEEADEKKESDEQNTAVDQE